MRCPKQPGVLLTGCRSPVSGMAAMDPLHHKGRRAGAVAFAKAQPRDLSMSDIVSQPWVLLAASLPVPAGQALQDPHSNRLTSGQRENLSWVLTAPTLGEHHWELTFPETIPKHPPPGKPSSSQTCLLLAKLRLHRAAHPGKGMSFGELQ